MKRIVSVLTLVALLMLCVPLRLAAKEPAEIFAMEGRVTCINEDWEFKKDGAASELVTLPHDYSIKEPFNTDYEAESGFLPGGKAIYRKQLIFPESFEGSRIVLSCGGVYMNAEVMVNGRKLGTHPYGYTSFAFDLSRDLICDGKTVNMIEISVDHELPSSRWYSGSGIYRDVNLIVTSSQYVAEDGIQIKTKGGSTQISAAIGNDSDKSASLRIVHAILDESDREVAKTEKEIQVKPESTAVFEVQADVENPILWSCEQPVQYTCHTEVLADDGTVLDETDTRYGYRTTRFDPDTGFYLNEKPVKLKGVCLHHDQGALGAAAYPAAIDRQLDLLQEMGINAIRTAHNPADAYLLEQCSRRGILVVEEAFDTWTNAKNHNDYDYSSIFAEPISADNEILGGEAGMLWAQYDIQQMVKDSMNEPCVILYSIGNEILGNIGGDVSAYLELAEQLCAWVNAFHTDKPVTIADNMTLKQDSVQLAMDEAVVSAGGVVGLNYATPESMDDMHEAWPEWPLFGSETVSAYGSRGEYRAKGIDETTYQVTAYDTECVEWGNTARQSWLDTIQRDYIAGEFVWTGFDYLGEPEPWNGLEPGSVTNGEPIPHSSYFGILDTAGLPKDSYYFYQSQWRDDMTVLHILPDWNRKNLRKNLFGFVVVNVYTNAPVVELFLNGKSLGKKTAELHTTDLGYTYQTYGGSLSANWQVWWRAGELEAVAYDAEGNRIESTSGRSIVRTSGAPSGLTMETNREELNADGTDLAYVTISLTDSSGNIVSDADQNVTVTVEGDGKLLALDNGNAADPTGYQEGTETERTRNTFHGKLVAIVQSTKKEGQIRITASAEGITDAKTVVHTAVRKSARTGGTNEQ